MSSIWWQVFLACGCFTLLLLAVVIYRCQYRWPAFKSWPTVSDLIDYAFLVDDNVLLLKSGSLMSMYALELPDLTMQPQSKINMVYELAQNALLKLDGHYCLHIDAVRNHDAHYIPALEVNHPVLKDIEERRMHLFQEEGVFHSQLYLSITYRGDKEHDQYLEGLLVNKKPGADLEREIMPHTQKLIKSFKQDCQNVVESLQEVFVVRPLSTKTQPVHPEFPQVAAYAPQTRTTAPNMAQDPCFSSANVDSSSVMATTATRTNGDADVSATTWQHGQSTASTASGDYAAQSHQIVATKLKPTYAMPEKLDQTKQESAAEGLMSEYAQEHLMSESALEQEGLIPKSTADGLMPESALEQESLMPKSTAESLISEPLMHASLASHDQQSLDPSSLAPHAQEHFVSPEPNGLSTALLQTKTQDAFATNLSLSASDAVTTDSKHTATHNLQNLNTSKVHNIQERVLDCTTLATHAREPSLATSLTSSLATSYSQDLALTKAQEFNAYASLDTNTSHLGMFSQFAPAMSIHEGLSFIHRCLTGKEQQIATPASDVYLDSLLSTADFEHGLTPKIGEQHICVLAIDGLPHSTTQGILNSLALLPFPCRFNTRFVYLNLVDSQHMLNQYRRLWSQKAKSIIAEFFNVKNTKINQNAVAKVNDIDCAQRALDNHELLFGSYTANLILMERDPNKLQAMASYAIKIIEAAGLGVRIETVNSTEAFLGSLPGHYYENLRRSIISQDVLLDLIPVSSPARGENQAPCPLYGAQRTPLMQVRAAGKSSYLLNLHDQDLGNTLVIGPPGSGKSVLLGELMLNLMRYRNMQIFAFDHSFSFYGLTKAMGGLHNNLEEHCERLCPLADIHTARGFDHALSFLHSLYELNQLSLSASDHQELVDSLQLMLDTKLPRTLSQLHMLLTTPSLKQTLQPYLSSQDNPSILDGKSNMSLGHMLTTFECRDLMHLPASFTIPVLKQLFYLIESKFNGEPAAIVLDEAWMMLKHPVFAAETIRWFKTLRKHNVIVILATQTLSDLEHSQEFNNLIECAKTRIYLANHAAESLPVAKAYAQLGLSPKEIYALAHAHAKKDYFFVKGEQHIMFNLMLSPEELRLLSFSGEQGRDTVDLMYQRFGHKFYTFHPLQALAS